MWCRTAALALFVCAAPRLARALPLLRLALAGGATEVGAGGLDAFVPARTAALTLTRPALLTDLTRPIFWLTGDDEATLSIGGDEFWAGTRADGFRSQATLAAPVRLAKMKLVLAASGRFETGTLALRNKSQGELIRVTEKRTTGQAAVAVKPLEWLRLGGEVGFGLGHAYGIEVQARDGPFRLGFVRRAEQLVFDASAPEGPKLGFQRPQLDYVIEQDRQVAAITAAVRLPLGELSGSADLLHPGDFTTQGALRLWRLAFRARLESTRYDFLNGATTGGQEIARVSLGVRVTRFSVATDLRLGASTFRLGHLETAVSTGSSWADLGAITGERLLSLDADLELYLRHAYGVSLVSDGLGWSWRHGRLGLAAGLEHLKLTSGAGGLTYGSKVLKSLDGKSTLPETIADLVGLTAGASLELGKIEVSLALAQFVPYASMELGSGPGGSHRAGSPPKTTSTGKLGSQWTSFDGGRLLVLEVEREF